MCSRPIVITINVKMSYNLWFSNKYLFLSLYALVVLNISPTQNCGVYLLLPDSKMAWITKSIKKSSANTYLYA
jgi:hypothetical protein